MRNFTRNLNKVLIFCLCMMTNISLLAQNRIVGGEDASISDYPWQVALTNSPSGGGFCGGSIISDSWVLTAAHCVSWESPSSLYIRVGSSSAYAYGGDSYSVSQIISHPNYSGESNDLALVEINGTNILLKKK